MNKVSYIDTSASRRTRALHSGRCDLGISNACCGRSNAKDDAMYISTLHCRNIKKTAYSHMWDQMSVDSGFSSDLERKVAQLSVAGSDVGSIDESPFDVINPPNQRPPSRAKLTAEEKQKRSKVRSLPPSPSARYHRHDDLTEYVSDDDIILRDMASPLTYNSHSRRSDKRSKTLQGKSDEIDVIAWDDVELSDLRQIRVLGGGGYARVDLVEIKRCPGFRLALKKMRKRMLQDRGQVDHVISEKEALTCARSRFIPRLYRTFQTPNHVFMLTEACLGGDLFSVLETYGALPYDATRYVIACIIEALDHLHRVLGIIHRDVKTENILIDANGVAKLADLGFCKRLPTNCDITHTFCGTPGYVAPEVLLRNGHGRPCDFFSTGVVMFEAVTCRSPFRRHSNMETHKATLRGIKDVAFPSFADKVTIRLIRSFCCNDPNQRIGAGGCEQVRRHDFFRGFEWHRMCLGKMTSPLINMTSTVAAHASTTVEDDYLENFTEIVNTVYDKMWSENF